MSESLKDFKLGVTLSCLYFKLNIPVGVRKMDLRVSRCEQLVNPVRRLRKQFRNIVTSRKKGKRNKKNWTSEVHFYFYHKMRPV